MRIFIDKMKYALIKEGYIFIKKILKHNASINTDEDIMKMQYTILRQNHVIEKGMSMRFPRKGFGFNMSIIEILRFIWKKRFVFSYLSVVDNLRIYQIY